MTWSNMFLGLNPSKFVYFSSWKWLLWRTAEHLSSNLYMTDIVHAQED